MTAGRQDIRFSCPHCGQRFVVDASGAGVETQCAGCLKSLVVPEVGSMMDREYVARAAGPGGERRSGGDRLGAGIREGKMPTPMVDSAREFSAERNQLRAEAGQSAVELKQARTEIAQLAQRLAALEAEAAEHAARRRQTEEDLELTREKAKALGTDVAAREKELASVRERVAALDRELIDAKAEISRLQDESDLHLHNYDDARAKLAAAEPAVARAEALSKELSGTQEKLAAAAERAHTLVKESETMRREFSQTESGRVLLDLRARAEGLDSDRKRLETELAEAKSETAKLTGAGKELQTQFEAMRTARDEAVRQLQVGSATGLQQVNEVLRGVLDRQKVELDERYTELRRLKKAELATRMLYLLFAILLVALIAYGIHILPQALK